MIRLVLADDHEMVREGLARLLEDEPDFAMVGTASDGLETVQVVEQVQPDVLVVDLMMPGLNGLEVTRQLTQKFPNLLVVVLSMHADEAYVLEALRNGARGYVLKESGRTDLVQAIHQVVAGRRYLSAPLTERAIELYLNQPQETEADPYERLTTREREVFQLLAEGSANKEVAERLSIGVRTVETHRAHIMDKLNVRTQAEIIHFAYQRGVLK